jgi:phosphohistidine phosphatase SixA
MRTAHACFLAFLLAPTVANAQRREVDTLAARGIAAAQRGGVVMVCRHGITDSFTENEMTLKYDDPATQRRLTAEGERQGEDLGTAFRALHIPIGEVIASPMQRTRRTAELVFGRPQLDSLWHTRGDDYDRKRPERAAVLGAPVRGANRVIVSHIGTIYSVVPSLSGKLNEGDCAVLQPLGDSRVEVVGVVPWRAWIRAARDVPR